MDEYVVLIVGDTDRWWTTMSAADREAGYARYTDFERALAERGHEVTGGAELTPSAGGRRLSAAGEVTDGPFTELAEQVGGFYQVRTADPDDLLDCCRILLPAGDGVELRRVIEPEERR